MAHQGDRPLRKDAAANRDRLLAAAGELFAERGLEVTLNDIAHHAGVGVGTAYRRFANKEQVIDALFEDSLQRVTVLARECLEQADPWQGLVSFLERSLHMQFGDRGLSQIMNETTLGLPRVADARDRIAPLFEQLVQRARSAGVVRADFDQSDIIFVQLAVASIMERTRDVAPDVYRRYLAMFLDGIRAPGHGLTALPVEPLTRNQTHEAMTWRRRNRR
jgi:AcrR family transcriptional regulator